MSSAYDRDKLVELFGDDPHTLAEVEREFLDTARVAEREITGTDDLAAIARVAHRLKGASGMIGAAALPASTWRSALRAMSRSSPTIYPRGRSIIVAE